jgi:hypothetical protein
MFFAPVLSAHTVSGVTTAETTVLTMTATGTTPGSRSVLSEKFPDAQAANNNPNVTEKLQLTAAANKTLFKKLIVALLLSC